MDNMKDKIILFLVLVIVIGFLYIFRKTSSPINNKNIDYISINDPSLIMLNKSPYYAAIDAKEQKTIPTDLMEYLVKDSNAFYSTSCKEKTDCTLENSEYNSTAIDLNSDGTEEYIVMPWKECGCGLRGASGNGDIYVISKKNDRFETIGYLQGNGFTVLNNKTNGYYDLIVNSHSTAATGSETVYKYQVFSNGGPTDKYEASFSKWYDYSRVKK